VIRAETLTGRPIIGSDTGRTVGHIVDTLVVPDSGAVAGFVVRKGWLSSEGVLRHGDVTALGDDAVLVRAAVGVLNPREWRDVNLHAIRASAFKNKPVVTRSGEKLGTVAGIYLDERAGHIEAYEIAERGFAGLVQRRSMLPHSSDVAVGRDAIVVTDVPDGKLSPHDPAPRQHTA
jgi:uncharacterized protein YrrD